MHHVIYFLHIYLYHIYHSYIYYIRYIYIFNYIYLFISISYTVYHIFSCIFLYLTVVAIDTTRVWWLNHPPKQNKTRDEAEAPHLCLVGHRQVPRQVAVPHGIWQRRPPVNHGISPILLSKKKTFYMGINGLGFFLPVGQLWSKKWSKLET